MKRRKKIMAVVLSIAVIFGTIIWQGKGDSRVLANTSSDAWELVWSDEFNDMSLNMDYWSYETSSMVWGSMETQYYTAGDNVKFDGNNLIIIPRRTIKNEKSSWTSARITTKKKKTFQYGKIEIRAKAAKGQGICSSGWMLGDGSGDTRGWPYDGEIDIMEVMYTGVPQGLHCEYWNNQSWSHGCKNYYTGLTPKECAEDFHTYGIIWTDKYIQFTTDGKIKGFYAPSNYSGSDYEQMWKGEFDHPFFFILNCAIGGNAAGPVSEKDWTLVTDTATKKVYEDYFYIDYVRVYRQKEKENKISKVSLKSARNIKGKRVKLTWKKVKNISTYEIIYASNKKFTKNKKTVKVKSSKNSKIITRLKKKKTYYFKVRAYRITSGKKVSGAWSKIKSVKIKK
ncbi:MAG: glycoside hydrolase family 16 protein [Eubacterium sp.]|nr:glycoside hydrolase family 16 protein [Eubacterium sp.]